MSDIKAFKMVTGEEVIAEIVSTQLVGGGYTLKRPHILRFQNMGGQLALALIPWTLANPDINNLEVPSSAVLLTYDVSSNVEKQYLEQTSGINLIS